MNSEPLWILLQVFLFIWALVGIVNLAIKWRLWRSRKKWESDEQILARYRKIKEIEESEGSAFDLWKKASAAIARRDWNKNKQTLEVTNHWARFSQWAGQLVVLYFAYEAYNRDDLKLLLLLAVLFLWRSFNYRGDMRLQLHILTLAALHMANPTAEDDFFGSEHCYNSDIHTRVWELLDKEGYFDRKP